MCLLKGMSINCSINHYTVERYPLINITGITPITPPNITQATSQATAGNTCNAGIARDVLNQEIFWPQLPITVTKFHFITSKLHTPTRKYTNKQQRN